MTIPEKIGDALNTPASIKLDCRFNKRREVKRLLKKRNIDTYGFMFYNRSLFTKGLIVFVNRYQETETRSVLRNNGYKEKY